MLANNEIIDPTSIGFIAVSVAAFCLGTFYPIAKRIETGDGLFFQWVMCSAIWFVGLAVQLIASDTVQFEPFAAIGGVLWCTGNIFYFPAIQCIGVKMVLAYWGATAMCVGWVAAKSKFIDNVDPEEKNKEWMSVIGFMACLFSLAIFFFVEQIPQEKKEPNKRLADDLYADYDTKSEFDPKEIAWHESLRPKTKKRIGIVSALISGALFGTVYGPSQYLINHKDQYIPKDGHMHSSRQIDYVFSHFSGIFMASTFYFLMYCSLMTFLKFQPHTNIMIVTPAYICGTIWGVGLTAWFIANEDLTMIITYPTIISGSAVVFILWSVIYLGDISGKKNYLTLLAAFFIVGVGGSLFVLFVR